MNRSKSSLRWFVRLSMSVALILVVVQAASAQQIARIVKYTLTDPAKQQAELFRLTDEINETYANSYAFQGLKLFYDPKTGECVAVSVWETRAGLQAATEADAFKGLLDKVKPLTKGDFTVKTFQVYQPKWKRK